MNSDHFSLVNGQNAYIYSRWDRVCDNGIVIHCGHVKDSSDLFALGPSAASGVRTSATYFFFFV